ncbi:hypothetical protein ONZ45_g4092 [Pleurotus djamor]|nr:hypothetical protein ONZ45_g4092 [Pleurotus djamor]
MPRHASKKAMSKPSVAERAQSPLAECVSNGEDVDDLSSDSVLHESTSQDVKEAADVTCGDSPSVKTDADSLNTLSASEEEDPEVKVEDTLTSAMEDNMLMTSDAMAFRPLDETEIADRYPEQSDLVRARFLKDGPYHQLLIKLMLTKSPSMFLATAKYRTHFLSSTTPREIAFIRGNGSLAIFTCFGEIASPEEGTVLTAKGNHFSGPAGESFKYLTDESKCKNILVLRRPSLAPSAVHHYFGEQISLLEKLMSVTTKVEDEQWRTYKWIRATSGDRDDTPNSIIVSTPRIYMPPPEGASSRTYKDSNIEMEDATMSSQNDKTPWSDVREGAVYDPVCLSDYGGPYFQLQKNKVAQQSFYDINNKLIPPWETYEKLRTGTLVVVNVALSCYISQREKRKFYTIKLQKLRVLAESDEQVHMRYVPGVSIVGREMERKIEENGEVDDFRAPKRHKLSVIVISQIGYMWRMPNVSWAEHAPVDTSANVDVFQTYIHSFDRLLQQHFFPRHFAGFRKMQSISGLVISGSTVLNFLRAESNTFNDLDLYVDVVNTEYAFAWMRSTGCIAHHKLEPVDFMNIFERLLETVLGIRLENVRDAGSDEMKAALRALTPGEQFAPGQRPAVLDVRYYSAPQILHVMDFLSPKKTKIQLIICVSGVMDTLLRFHSSQVMNFVTAQACYCLFPKETIEMKMSLMFKEPDYKTTLALKKYRNRGWVYLESEVDAQERRVFPAGTRTYGGSDCLRVPLLPVMPELDSAYDEAYRNVPVTLAYDDAYSGKPSISHNSPVVSIVSLTDGGPASTDEGPSSIISVKSESD